jgi:ferritin-like metal-binding protein YciE
MAAGKMTREVELMESLQDLYVHELKDIADAEKQLIKALPKMAKAASTDELRQAFEQHLQITETQLERVERILSGMGESPGRKKCKGMQGLIEEGQDLLKEDAEASVRDAGLITAAQKVEHYEIAAYGSLRAYAEFLSRDEEAQDLQKSLDEEGEADKKLSALAEGLINAQAANGDG